MKIKIIVLIAAMSLFFKQTLKSQDVYPISAWEFLFQFANMEKQSTDVTNKLRFTIIFNLGQYWHIDFNNNVGMYSGLAVRNVGFIYDTPLPTKTIRRSYTLGIPLALKFGAFDKHVYFLAGGEYELLFHYRARKWLSNSRDGTKSTDSEWFSKKTKRFVPSVFAGFQFPGGFNIKFKYYIQHFLNENYVGADLGESEVSFSDYTKLNMMYVSLSWQFRTDQWRKYVSYEERMASAF
jgi:hypothetical protein